MHSVHVHDEAIDEFARPHSHAQRGEHRCDTIQSEENSAGKWKDDRTKEGGWTEQALRLSAVPLCFQIYHCSLAPFQVIFR